MKVKILISNILIQRFREINDRVSNFILYNLETEKENVKNNHPQYLDFDGNLVTYLNSNKETENPWNCDTRQGTKAVKVLRKIFKNEYISQNLEQRDIENFVSSWNASGDKSSKVVVYKGWDILKAFNFTGMLNMKKFQASCANFKQSIARKLGKTSWDEPMIKWFYFYIYNENISTAVVIENGTIKARSVIFEGEQVGDSGDFKKGQTYTILNNIYSEGEEKYKFILKEWAKERGYLFKISSVEDLKTKKNLNGYLKLSGFKLHYKTYPPVDSIWGNIEKGYITNDCGYNYKSLYKLYQNGGNHKIKNEKVG